MVWVNNIIISIEPITYQDFHKITLNTQIIASFISSPPSNDAIKQEFSKLLEQQKYDEMFKYESTLHYAIQHNIQNYYFEQS